MDDGNPSEIFQHSARNRVLDLLPKLPGRKLGVFEDIFNRRDRVAEDLTWQSALEKASLIFASYDVLLNTVYSLASYLPWLSRSNSS